MEKPMFYFGSCYLWTLMVLSLTGMGMAVGLMVATVPVCIFLIDRLRRPVQGKQKLKFFLAAGAIVLVACIAFLLQTMLVYRPALSHAGEEVSDTFLVTEVLNDSASGAHRCVVLVEGREPVRRLRLSSDTYEPRVGDVFRGTLQLKALGEQNPAVARYYKSRGLYLGATSSGRIDADPLDETEARGDVTVPPVRLAWWTLRIRLTTLRETLTGRIEEWLPPEEAGVLEGMLVGDKTDIGPDTNTAFQKAGVLHLFAVSGFHVSLWTMLVYKILLHIGAGRKTASGGTILFLFLFVALTGFPRSAVRAGIMLGVFFLSRMFVRSSEPLNALGVAVLVIVLMERIHNYKLRKRVESPLAVLLVSLCSFVFTLPVMVLTFGNVSLVTLLSNLLVSSASSAAILLTGLGSLVAPVPGLSLLCPWCFLGAGVLARFMVSACSVLAGLPLSYISLSGRGFGLGLAGALLVAVAGFILYGSLQERGLIRVTALLSVIVLLGSIFTETALNRNVTQVVFPDVEGSCAVVIHRHGAAIIGCGSDEYGTEQALKDLFQREGVTKVSALVVPRESKTEAGAVKAVREAFEPEVYLSPETFAGPAEQVIDLWPEVSLHLYRQGTDYPAARLEVQGVDSLLLFRPTVKTEALPPEARSAAICYLRGKRSEGLKLPTSSYIIVSGESGEVDARVSKGRFRLYRR